MFVYWIHLLILRLIYPLPFLGIGYFLGQTLVLAEEFHQFVAADPDFIIAFFLGFVENQLDTKVEVRFVDRSEERRVGKECRL